MLRVLHKSPDFREYNDLTSTMRCFTIPPSATQVKGNTMQSRHTVQRRGKGFCSFALRGSLGLSRGSHIARKRHVVAKMSIEPCRFLLVEIGIFIGHYFVFFFLLILQRRLSTLLYFIVTSNLAIYISLLYKTL